MTYLLRSRCRAINPHDPTHTKKATVCKIFVKDEWETEIKIELLSCSKVSIYPWGIFSDNSAKNTLQINSSTHLFLLNFWRPVWLQLSSVLNSLVTIKGGGRGLITQSLLHRCLMAASQGDWILTVCTITKTKRKQYVNLSEKKSNKASHITNCNSLY